MFRRARSWYARYERPLSSASLVLGFVFDALTLKRVDLFWENLWVAAHFLGVAVCMILVHMHEDNKIDSRDPDKIHFWFISVLQFFFGGLLSTFLVFYFRSGSIAASWPFILILTIAFIANESLRKHADRLNFHLGLFFLSIFAFTIFIVPVFLHQIGPTVFIISGAVSLLSFWIFMMIFGYFAGEKFERGRTTLILVVGGIFVSINFLYFANLIPPIPLSLKASGIYHSIARNIEGEYVVEREDKDPFSFLNFSEDVHVVKGDTLYAYNAIFSPPYFNTNIIHEWQWHDPKSGKWITKSSVDLTVPGGREEGYRTYSLKRNLDSGGKWRVNVLTAKGQLIGRMRFNLVLVTSEPPLTTEVLR